MRTVIVPGRWPMLSMSHSAGGGVVQPQGNSFSTSFSSAQNPLGDSWILGQTTGVDWGDFQASGGIATGLRAADFRDNTAVRPGTWSPNQSVTTTVFKGSPNNTFFPEVENRLRTTITANSITGYEVGWSLRGGASSYLIIVRWNGPFGDFTYLFNTTSSIYQVVDGDIITSRISGNIITAALNGVDVQSVDITSVGGTVYSTGNPGMGTNCNSGGGAQLNQYGFYDFSATDL